MKVARASLLVVAIALLLSSMSFAGVVYNQDFDQTGNLYSSQNDTNGFGLFAQVYDNFTLGSSTTITEAMWTGGYFNPPNQGQITGFTLSIYGDAAGQPGSLLYTTHVNSTAGETFLGNFGGFPVYTYDLAGLNFSANAGTQYWLSVYPDLGFPPQWGWASGNGGDGLSYQDFQGVRSQLSADMAFTLIGGNVGTPEPSSLMLLGAGLLGFASKLRRK